LRDGRFGAYVQDGEGSAEEKPKRASVPKTIKPDEITLTQAIALLSLPREVAKHPISGDPIVAGIGRFGPYVQHAKTYANLTRDDDVLAIGANRAIDLIVEKESGGGGSRFGRSSGDHPDGGAVTVKSGRFGPYVNWGKINATIPKGTDPATLTLDEAVALLAAKAAAGGGGRVLGDHPGGGAVTLREGRFGPYVAWGKVNATLPQGMSLEEVSLDEAIRLIDAKAAAEGTKAPAKKAAAKKAYAKLASVGKAKKTIEGSEEPPFEGGKAVKPAAKKAPPKTAAAK